MCWFIVAMFGAPVTYISISPASDHSVVVDRAGEVVGHLKPGRCLMSLDLLAGKIHVYDVRDKIGFSTQSSVTMLVNDLIVRKTTYSLKIEVGRHEAALSLAVRRFGFVRDESSMGAGSDYNGRIQEFISSVTYDLNDQFGDQLKDFSNPSDKRQRRDFLALMHQLLDSTLWPVGLELTSATFEVS